MLSNSKYSIITGAISILDYLLEMYPESFKGQELLATAITHSNDRDLTINVLLDRGVMSNPQLVHALLQLTDKIELSEATLIRLVTLTMPTLTENDLEEVLEVAVRDDLIDLASMMLNAGVTAGIGTMNRASMTPALLSIMLDKGTISGQWIDTSSLDLSSTSSKDLGLIVLSNREQISDKIEGAALLSRMSTEQVLDILSSKWLFAIYPFEAFLQAIILKSLSYERSLNWLIEQTAKRMDATLAMQIIIAMNSSRSKRAPKYKQPLMVAFAGFFLLARAPTLFSVHHVMNTLEIERANREGIDLAGALLGGLVGKKLILHTA